MPKESKAVTILDTMNKFSSRYRKSDYVSCCWCIIL